MTSQHVPSEKTWLHELLLKTIEIPAYKQYIYVCFLNPKSSDSIFQIIEMPFGNISIYLPLCNF